MNNYIAFSIEETSCIPVGDLYKLDIKVEEENNYTVNWAYIYFITKVPKYRIEEVTQKGLDFIEILLKKGEKELCKVQTKIDDLFRLGHLIAVFKKQGILDKETKYPIYFEIVKIESKSIDFILHIGANGFTLTIPIQDILLNIQATDSVREFIKQPEIIYIGKTLKKIKRFLKHSKLQKSLAICEDNQEIMIWPTIFKTDFLVSSDSNESSKFNETTTDLDVDKKKIDLLEFALIQFFRPINNEQLKDTVLSDSNSIKHYRKYDVNALSLQWACHQFFCNFWSPGQQIKKTSTVSLHFDFFEVGFSDHIIINMNGKAHFEKFSNIDSEYSNPAKPIDYVKIENDIIKNW